VNNEESSPKHEIWQTRSQFNGSAISTLLQGHCRESIKRPIDEAAALGAKRLIDHAVHQLMRAGWGKLATSRSQVRLDFLFNQANDRIRNWHGLAASDRLPGADGKKSRADKNRRNNSADGERRE
jgi:hypothetical protein